MNYDVPLLTQGCVPLVAVLGTMMPPSSQYLGLDLCLLHFGQDSGWQQLTQQEAEAFVEIQ